MRLTVVVLAYNSAGFVRECVDSVLGTATNVGDVEIVVVNNGSSDQTGQVIAEAYACDPRVRLAELRPGRSYAYANDWAVETSNGDVYLFLNDDCVVEAGALQVLLRELEEAPLLGAVQMAASSGDGQQWDSLGHYIDSFGLLTDVGLGAARKVLSGPPVAVFGGYGAALAVRREAYKRAGGFDRVMEFLGEETDLCWRIWLTGFEVATSRMAVVRHRGLKRYAVSGQGVRPSPFRLEFQHRLRSMVKNCGPGWLWWAVPAHVALRLAYAVCLVPTAGVGPLGDVVAAVRWNLTHFRSLIEARQIVQARRVVSDRSLVRRGVIASRAGWRVVGWGAPRVTSRRGHGVLPSRFREWWV